jgi:hypothetical protein
MRRPARDEESLKYFAFARSQYEHVRVLETGSHITRSILRNRLCVKDLASTRDFDVRRVVSMALRDLARRR